VNVDDLTHKQRLFVGEYLVDFNAAAAARRAGYSEKTADRIGHRLLRKVEIQQAVDEATEERLKSLGVTAHRVLEELARLGFSNMLDYVRIGEHGDAYVDLSQMTREQAAAVQEVTVEDFRDGRGGDAREVRRVKFKLADKKSSLELLGKYLKLFTEKHEHSGPGGGPIQTIEVVGVSDEREDEATD
jgi:phage terminase small subunit